MKIKLLYIIIFLANYVSAAEEIVVTPTKFAQNVSEVIPSVIIIDKQTIQQTPAANLADLLRWYAGIEMARTGGVGQQTSVFIRGANSNHTSVLINGVKMNSSTTGAPAFEAINTSFIERIEIVKGPRSTLYGSEAIGGVINIITSSDEIKNEAQVHFSNGRYSTTQQGFDFKISNNFLNADVSFAQLQSDGFPTVASSNTDHGHDNDTLDINLNTNIANIGFTFGYWQAEGNTEYDGFGVDLDQDRKNDVFSMAVSVPITEFWDSNFSISKVRDEIRQNQINFLGDEDFAFTDRIVYDWKNDLSILNTHLSFGATMTDEETQSLSFGTRYKENTDDFSLYINHKMNIGKHRVFGSTRYINHDDFGDELVWNAEYAYQVSNQLRLFASYATGFRAPDSNARFGFGGNPDLREEKSRSTELGLDCTFNDSTGLSLRLYENKIEDLIETILIDPGMFIFENRNVSEARIQGMEITFQHQSDLWDFNLEGSIKEPKNETNDSLLLRRSKRSLHSSFAYKNENYFVRLNGLLTSERVDFGGATLSGYGLLNFAAGIHFPYSTISLKFENILDKDYELASGFNTPGQSVFAELRVNFTE